MFWEDSEYILAAQETEHAGCTILTNVKYGRPDSDQVPILICFIFTETYENLLESGLCKGTTPPAPTVASSPSLFSRVAYLSLYATHMELTMFQTTLIWKTKLRFTSSTASTTSGEATVTTETLLLFVFYPLYTTDSLPRDTTVPPWVRGHTSHIVDQTKLRRPLCIFPPTNRGRSGHWGRGPWCVLGWCAIVDRPRPSSTKPISGLWEWPHPRPFSPK